MRTPTEGRMRPSHQKDPGMGGCGDEEVRALPLLAALCSASSDRGFSRNCER